MNAAPRMLFYTALAVLVTALAVYWFLDNFEWVTEEVETGYEGEAARNPLLAAQRLMERMGIPVETLRALTPNKLPFAKEDSLVLWQEEIALQPLQEKALLDWVLRGGRLVMSSQSFFNEEAGADYILDALKIQQHYSESESSEMIQYKVPWQGKTLRLSLYNAYYLSAERAPLRRISGKEGEHFLEYPYGLGRVMIFSDFMFIANDNIGENDHAEFFWHLVNNPSSAPKVWLLHPLSSGISLWRLLWNAAAPLVVSCAVVLFFWLWRVSRRFGPELPQPPLRRRRLLEHLEAGGRFLWRHQQARNLMRSASQSLWEHIERAHPDWLRLSRPLLVERLSGISGLPAEAVHSALEPAHDNADKTRSGGDFTHTVQTIAQLRKVL